MKSIREKNLRVALYGGSFDPPHVAHEAIVKVLREQDFIDEVVVMPTFLNPFKSKFVAPAKLRLAWLEEIFKTFKDVKVSSFEVDLAKKTPSIITVENLLKSYEEVYLVIGADNLATLNSWHRYEELKDKVTFIVITRDGVDIPPEFIKLYVDETISSSALRNKIDINKLAKQNALEIEQYYMKNKEKNAN